MQTTVQAMQNINLFDISCSTQHSLYSLKITALTEEESGDRALELEEVPDDGSAPAWSNGGGIHSSDVREALALLSIDGVPHQGRSPKQCVLRPACNVAKLHNM